jgi:hypothetical protein
MPGICSGWDRVGGKWEHHCEKDAIISLWRGLQALQDGELRLRPGLTAAGYPHIIEWA